MVNSLAYSQLKSFSEKEGIPFIYLIELLKILRNTEKIQNYDLITLTGLSKVSINTFQKQFKQLFAPVSRFTVLSDKGSLFTDEVLRFCQNTKAETTKTSFERTNPKRHYDQFLATQETVSKRATKMDEMFDVQDKRILFLGDDDHTSIVVGLLNKHKNITIIDIDNDILSSIDAVSKNLGIKLETIQCDLRNSFPKALKDSFDVVFTDPPYTPEGIELFLGRAVEALDPKNKSARIYFCYGHSDLSKERFLPIYEKCIQSGLMLRWIFDKFNRYNGAESIGNSSSLFICEITDKTKLTIKGAFKKGIYTDKV